jgi:hypothetical protein
MCVWSNVLESVQTMIAHTRVFRVLTMIALSAHIRALVKKRVESLAPPIDRMFSLSAPSQSSGENRIRVIRYKSRFSGKS